MLKLSPEELAALQSEIKKLGDEFDRYYAGWLGAKVRFINLTKGFTSNVAAPMQHEIPQAEASAQPTEEHASTADDNQAAEENESTRADDSIPAAEDIPRASTSGAPEENEEVRATASVVPEENQPHSSAPPAPTPTPILPSASDVKKTKAAERAAVKKRKASTSSNSSAPKKMKPLTSSIDNPIDAVPVSFMPSKNLVPFGEDYVISNESDEETSTAASTEQLTKKLKWLKSLQPQSFPHLCLSSIVKRQVSKK